MENKALAEQELKELIAKYPSLEFFVTTNFAVGFKEKEVVAVEVEAIAPTPESIPETVETPVVDAVTVEPTIAQPEA